LPEGQVYTETRPGLSHLEQPIKLKFSLQVVYWPFH
jgi:hypothetical protein